ncbi:hypothetical protein ACE4ZV_26420, partial [Salmonella enterica]|uniref:hypothetical protein n=1 Tax=Salmonella enterica TaxID=28901 RepID=UPI003D2C9591
TLELVNDLIFKLIYNSVFFYNSAITDRFLWSKAAFRTRLPTKTIFITALATFSECGILQVSKKAHSTKLA